MEPDWRVLEGRGAYPPIVIRRGLSWCRLEGMEGCSLYTGEKKKKKEEFCDGRVTREGREGGARGAGIELVHKGGTLQ